MLEDEGQRAEQQAKGDEVGPSDAGDDGRDAEADRGEDPQELVQSDRHAPVITQIGQHSHDLERNERRRALGIPVHSDEEHVWTRDGYCNCGASKPRSKKGRLLPPRNPYGPVGKINLDVVEGNWEEYH